MNTPDEWCRARKIKMQTIESVTKRHITCALGKNGLYLKYESIDDRNLIKCLKWKEFERWVKMVPAPTSFPHINSWFCSSEVLATVRGQARPLGRERANGGEGGAGGGSAGRRWRVSREPRTRGGDAWGARGRPCQPQTARSQPARESSGLVRKACD